MSEPIGQVTVRTSATRTRLVLSGEVDMSLADELSAAVDEVLALRLPVDVDAREVTFLDSSGLSKLVQLAASSATRPRLIEPPDFVTFLLEVTRLDEVMDIVATDPGFPDGEPGSDLVGLSDRRDAV
ncbi:STAS domain-containing protein [Georgenia sp. EYE_87]|uniref:STAS domain-containing protein n=1 Tax=Georgenia sp. EYE_87 TaxID=2853448 RepID=UPI002002D369|nr:STAS domain-containing protein [Georgenia sp. EYE_87]MCK6210725.1 STAS domain-containing protein [Georgenia sp. EYE_87]